MIVWEATVFRGRSPEDKDAHRIKEALRSFLADNSALDFGKLLEVGCM